MFTDPVCFEFYVCVVVTAYCNLCQDEFNTAAFSGLYRDLLSRLNNLLICLIDVEDVTVGDVQGQFMYCISPVIVRFSAQLSMVTLASFHRGRTDH